MQIDSAPGNEDRVFPLNIFLYFCRYPFSTTRSQKGVSYQPESDLGLSKHKTITFFFLFIWCVEQYISITIQLLLNFKTGTSCRQVLIHTSLDNTTTETFSPVN